MIEEPMCLSEYLPLEIFLNCSISKDVRDNINVRMKNGMYLYNYNQKDFVPRNHPILMFCRGLVLREDGTVLNFPFKRFFNSYEKEAIDVNIDWDSAEIQEKIDGSLICVFWLDVEWEITTRGSFYPNPKAIADFKLLFLSKFDKFDELNKDFCYMFEIVTDKNRVVTWYDDSFVVLVGIRNLKTLEEVSQKDLDLLAKIYLDVRRPKRYLAKNLDECKSLFAQLRDDEEGLVVVDKDFNRLKLKQDSYLQMVKIKMLKEDEILDYVRGKIELDGELLQKDKQVSAKIDGIRSEWLTLLDLIESTFDEIKNAPNRKDFAMKASGYPFKSFLFYMLDERETSEMRLTYDTMMYWLEDKENEDEEV